MVCLFAIWIGIFALVVLVGCEGKRLIEKFFQSNYMKERYHTGRKWKKEKSKRENKKWHRRDKLERGKKKSEREIK